MVQSVAVSITKQFLKVGVIEAGQMEIYIYGLEVLLSSLLNILVIIIISLLMCNPTAWLFFLISFVPQRLSAGGYHASSHFRCTTVGAISFASLIMLSNLLPMHIWNWLSLVTCILNLLLVLKLAPVQTVNNPLSGKEVQRNRIISLYIAHIHLVCPLLMFTMPLKDFHIMKYYTLGIFIAGVSLVVGDMKNKKERMK